MAGLPYVHAVVPHAASVSRVTQQQQQQQYWDGVGTASTTSRQEDRSRVVATPVSPKPPAAVSAAAALAAGPVPEPVTYDVLDPTEQRARELAQQREDLQKEVWLCGVVVENATRGK
eukprot:TRINITY_DN10599_c1_g1_i1.p2 TRINITY_DN10599_c1_g1~~TRINITY_DN10599_c1_g1_i1.p2  ORF type:complete len:136 (+),score=25.34 TRINITY_DN10599_c1_g1_i1:59-409(+)